MMNFYSMTEFESMMVQLMITEGISHVEAYNLVRQREIDAAEYQKWLDAQAFDHEGYRAWLDSKELELEIFSEFG